MAIELNASSSDALAALRDMTGYLNFSSGSQDIRFLAATNELFRQIEGDSSDLPTTCEDLSRLLTAYIASAEGSTEAFRDLTQAKAIVRLVFDELLPAYVLHHADLLYHQPRERLFRPFFVARACEAVLLERPPWEPTRRVVEGAIERLNDYLGHRPLAVLRTAQRIEPYSHERVRPIPYYIKGVGVGVGVYRELIGQALSILEATSQDVLGEAHFDLTWLEEMAIDPRSYDFDHPVNKRPNYQFGQWDPHRVNAQGYYTRFVVQEVTLATVRQRVEEPSEHAREELLFEAGAVLAGTILMASCTSGSGPAAHDSETTLGKLLPRIARFRDIFYERLLATVEGQHGERLRAEAELLRQPFGGARQHLNQRLAHLRATQLQHVHLAQLYARMGYAEASLRQAHVVPVASARMLCEINTRITAAYHEIDHARLDQAAALLPTITDLVRRAIECGAMLDPWNILGFQGQFSLFPAMENSVADHRVNVLVHVVAQMFGLYARLESEAASAAREDLRRRVDAQLAALAEWWDRFATIEVGEVESISGREVVESARRVASALGAWRAAGAEAGAVAFWRPHVEGFNSAKAYALVVETLIEKGDFVAARALLIQWLSQVEEMPLEEGPHSFHDLAARWAAGVCDAARDGRLSPTDRMRLLAQFIDLLEANAEAYWEVPGFRTDNPRGATVADEFDLERDHDDDEDADDPRGLYRSAYEDMSYRDSAIDDRDGSLAESGEATSDYELDLESKRITRRLAFLVTVARVWQLAATAAACDDDLHAHRDTLAAWFDRAQANRARLVELLQAAHDFRIPPPRGAQETMVEYDRRRLVKESLLGRIIHASVRMAGAARLVRAADDAPDDERLDAWERAAVAMLRPMLRGDRASVIERFPEFRQALESKTSLYVPLSKGGSPRKIVESQSIQQVLLLTLAALPRLGLITECCELIAAAHAMERNRPPGEGGVTEFDRLFDTGVSAAVECLIDAAPVAREPQSVHASETQAAVELIDSLQTLAESLLKVWLAHSRSLRLSVLEKVGDQERWGAVVDFIERYGHDLLTQRFMNLGNLRAIWHQGVDAWLLRVETEDGGGDELALIRDLDRVISRTEAAAHLGLVIEAVVENYAEYKDFNSTTTQSDRGELLYTLLDFLRLKASYDRFAWNIRPVILIHDILVRRDRPVAAELWRRAVAERTSEVADWHLARHAELTRRYGMRLPTIAERLEQRFVQPLAIDRVRALVAPAMRDARAVRVSAAFSLLEQEIRDFTDHPAGAGLDVPAWLVALEEEVERSDPRQPQRLRLEARDIFPHVTIGWDEAQRQVRTWTEPAS